MSEEVKAIVEVIGQLGESGTTAFIWYLVLGLVDTLLYSVVVLITIVFLARFGLKLFGACTGLERLAITMQEPNKYPDNWSIAIQKAIDSRFWEKSDPEVSND